MDRGAALIDLVAACAVVCVVGAVAMPAVQATRDRHAGAMAATFLAQRMQMLRVEAVRRNRNVAMRFDPSTLGLFATYVDGDGDGVLQRDIDAGVDTILDAEAQLTDFFAGAELRVAEDVPGPDGSGTIVAGSDPVRLGSTNLLSFTPVSTATNGTIYLVAGAGPQMCVRVFGATGRVRVLWFDRAAGVWRDD